MRTFQMTLTFFCFAFKIFIFFCFVAVNLLVFPDDENTFTPPPPFIVFNIILWNDGTH